MQNHYLADDAWHALARDLIEAAKHPADPESEIKLVLAAHGIMPEGCREDCGDVVQVAA